MGEMRDFASELPYILSRSQLAKSIVKNAHALNAIRATRYAPKANRHAGSSACHRSRSLIAKNPQLYSLARI